METHPGKADPPAIGAAGSAIESADRTVESANSHLDRPDPYLFWGELFF